MGCVIWVVRLADHNGPLCTYETIGHYLPIEHGYSSSYLNTEVEATKLEEFLLLHLFVLLRFDLIDEVYLTLKMQA